MIQFADSILTRLVKTSFKIAVRTDFEIGLVKQIKNCTFVMFRLVIMVAIVIKIRPVLFQAGTSFIENLKTGPNTRTLLNSFFCRPQ